MKKILILVLALMCLFTLTSAAMATQDTQPRDPAGYYQHDVTGAIKYFANGHPGEPSQWTYLPNYDPEDPPTPPTNDCCNDAYVNTSLEGGWEAPTAVGTKMSGGFGINAFSYVYGGGEVTAEATITGYSDGQKYSQRIKNEDGTATIGAIVGSASWTHVDASASGYINVGCSEGGCVEKCKDGIDLGVSGGIFQYTSNALNLDNSSGFGAGNWAMGEQISEVTFDAGASTKKEDTLSLVATGDAIGGTVLGVYSTGSTSIAGAVTGGMSYGSHNGTTGTVQASGQGQVAHGTYASMNGAAAVTFGTASYCYDVIGNNYAIGAGYAYTYGISTVAQYGQNGVMATTYTKSGACSGGNCGSVPSFNQ